VEAGGRVDAAVVLHADMQVGQVQDLHGARFQTNRFAGRIPYCKGSGVGERQGSGSIASLRSAARRPIHGSEAGAQRYP
jgi:hypothetical protein